MAGKFINTTSQYTEIINKAADISKGLLDNPYYLYSDKKATEVTYYNINTTMTTVDESTRGNYSEISVNSPIRFNKIKNFMLYGITKVEPNLDIGEFGLESSDITGEAIVLPKTIIPYPGDYFTINQLSSSLLFKVTSVNPNTLDTGITMYRINYTLCSSDGLKKIEAQVVKTFIFSINTGGVGSDNGSNLSSSIIDENIYDKSKDLQDYSTVLKDYFIALFYDAKVQSFTYNYKVTPEWRQNNGYKEERSNYGVFEF